MQHHAWTRLVPSARARRLMPLVGLTVGCSRQTHPKWELSVRVSDRTALQEEYDDDPSDGQYRIAPFTVYVELDPGEARASARTCPDRKLYDATFNGEGGFGSGGDYLAPWKDPVRYRSCVGSSQTFQLAETPDEFVLDLGPLGVLELDMPLIQAERVQPERTELYPGDVIEVVTEPPLDADQVEVGDPIWREPFPTRGCWEDITVEDGVVSGEATPVEGPYPAEEEGNGCSVHLLLYPELPAMEPCEVGSCTTTAVVHHIEELEFAGGGAWD